MEMHARWFRRARPLVILATLLALGTLACGGGEDADSPAATATMVATNEPRTATTAVTAAATADAGAPSYDFPTGDAVLVPADYVHPDDHVDNTGTYLPANGKPTLVFVDAIW
jgi:hypothetical protein